MGRLIDADELLKEIEETAISVENARSGETIKKAFLQCLATVREGIIRTPTAYNVDAVVAELEKASKTMLPVIPTKEAISIVKRGGV